MVVKVLVVGALMLIGAVALASSHLGWVYWQELEYAQRHPEEVTFIGR